MTSLEQIIRETTARTTVTTVSTVTDKFAESLARELLKDPKVKAELLAIVRRAFHDTWASMNQPTPPTP